MEQSKQEPVFRIGPIRPPSEANSLLLQVTQGCTWNKCKFCELYQDTKFRAFSADSIKQDIDAIAYYAEKAKPFIHGDGTFDRIGLNRILSSMEPQAQNCFSMVVNWLLGGGQTVFLQDGNTLALQNGRLSDVLSYLKQTFPQITRITSYGRAESLSRISAEEYAELHAAGLTRIHSGFESGSDQVLQLIHKGVTAQQEIQAGKNIKAGGIEFSVYFMPGVGGKALSQENARGMAEVVSEIDPDFVRIRTAAIKPGTQLYEDFLAGHFELCTDDEKVLEIKTLIEQSHCERASIVSDHIINLLPHIMGSLGRDKAVLLGIIEEYLSLPTLDRRLYQLLRRYNAAESVSDLSKLSASERSRLEEICRQTDSDAIWAEQMNSLIARYV